MVKSIKVFEESCFLWRTEISWYWKSSEIQ